MRVVITSPSVNLNENVSGIAAVTQFITQYNTRCSYTHFTVGKKDVEKRDVRWLLSLFGMYARWLSIMTARRHSLVHFNLAFDKRGLLRDSPLILMAGLLRQRVVIHIHGGELLMTTALPKWLRMLAARTLRTGPVIVLSAVEQRRIQDRFPAANVFVLPNCIAVEEAASFERNFDGTEPLHLLFLGRIEPNKGIDVLYAALELLRRRGLKVRFTLAGSGPLESTYVPRFEELLGADFEFCGVIGGAAKLSLLRRCDVFVLPSRFEGLPIALLESMAFGLVPVVTNVGSITTVVADDHNGIVLSKQDTTELAAALYRLAEDRPLLRSLSKNCRAHILETCRADRYVRDLNEVYQHG